MTPADKKYSGRFLFILIFAFFVWGALIIKLYSIQVIAGEKYRSIGSSQVKNKKSIPAIRGNIYDRSHKALTMNVPQYSFGVHPSLAKDKYALAVQLSQSFDRSRSHYLQRLQTKKPFVWLERNIAKEDAEEFLTFSDPGLVTQINQNRHYPYNEIAAQIIGFTDVDGNGLSGIEVQYDSLLSGKPGWTIMRKDGRGGSIPSPNFPTIDPTNGHDVELTIDFEFQTILREELAKGMQKYGAKQGMAIIMNPQTGAILAMTSLPSFDPNKPSAANPEYMKNRLVTDIFEPGSTTKIVVATAAISENMVDQNDIFFCENGRFEVNGEIIHDHNLFGWLTFKDVIVNSSNIGTIKIAQKIGRDIYYQYLRKFGFGTPTGINFIGEEEGILHPLNSWSKISLASASIGHEMSVTGLQMANAFAAIANNGYLMKPYLVNRIYDENGKVVIKNEPTVIRRVTDKQSAQKVKAILEEVVEAGTGTNAQIKGIRIAGKTGTAQKVFNGKYSQKEYFSSFIGFLPAENPELLCAVYLDSPEFGQHWGGYAAAPITREIFLQIINSTDGYYYDDIAPEQPLIRRAININGSEKPEAQISLSTQLTFNETTLQKKRTQNTQNPFRMPNVTNMSLRKALTILYRYKLDVEIEGFGRVQHQSPEPGAHVKPGIACQLELGD